MKNYIIYIEKTGQIIRYGFCPDDDYFLQAQIDENIMEGTIDCDSYILNNEIVSIPPAPNQYCVFDYDAKQWVDPRTYATQWPIVKNQRDVLLLESDWTQLPDVLLSDKAAWVTYRQELRDITKQADPFNIVWPIPPAG